MHRLQRRFCRCDKRSCLLHPVCRGTVHYVAERGLRQLQRWILQQCVGNSVCHVYCWPVLECQRLVDV